MAVNEILQEAQKLRSVSENLKLMAEENEPVSEQLSILSGNIGNSAMLLEVLVQLKLNPHPSPDFAIN